MDKNRHMENNRRKKSNKEEDQRHQRIKEQHTRYSILDKEVKRKTKADKREFIENLAHEAETAAQMQNMATLLDTKKHPEK